MRHYLDRQVTPPEQATSPILGPLPPCKQALTHTYFVKTCSSSVGEDRGWNQENGGREVVEERVGNGCSKSAVSYLKKRSNSYSPGPSCSTRGCAIHRINLCPLDSAIGFPNTYPQDRDLCDGLFCPAFEQLGPGLGCSKAG